MSRVNGSRVDERMDEHMDESTDERVAALEAEG